MKSRNFFRLLLVVEIFSAFLHGGWMNCPLPTSRYDAITLAHGGGGTWTTSLLESIFWPAFGRPERAPHDSAVFSLEGKRAAITTDSYVVQPLFFPGGDIGSLAVCGTINDLLMSGSRPVALTVGFILEEGLPLETLRRVVESMATAAKAAGVSIVAGDTKVIGRASGDGIYINTSGVGEIVVAEPLAPERICAGDVVVLTGDIGRHGIAVMAERHGLTFEPQVVSDVASVQAPMLELFAKGLDVHCARDLTRGGLGGALCELATAAGVAIQVEESKIPVVRAVRGACGLLGFDPLFVANEGCAVLFVERSSADAVLDILRRHAGTAQACVMGEVSAGQGVSARTAFGTVRRIAPPAGEQLPRIC